MSNQTSENSEPSSSQSSQPAVGTVISISGSPVSVCVLENLEVQRVALALGESVQLQQVLETGPGSSLVIRWDNGETWAMGESSRAEVHSGLTTKRVTVAESGFDTDDIKQMQDALEEGQDPSELAPTAVGGNGISNDDGTNVVIVERGNASDPYSGFQTTGVDTDGLPGQGEQGEIIRPDDIIPDDIVSESPVSLLSSDITLTPQIGDGLSGNVYADWNDNSHFDSDDGVGVGPFSADYQEVALELSGPSGQPISVDYDIYRIWNETLDINDLLTSYQSGSGSVQIGAGTFDPSEPEGSVYVRQEEGEDFIVIQFDIGSVPGVTLTNDTVVLDY